MIFRGGSAAAFLCGTWSAYQKCVEERAGKRMKTKRAIWKTALSFLLAAALLAAGIPAAAYEALGADDALQPAAASAAIHPMSYRPRRRRKWWARSRSCGAKQGRCTAYRTAATRRWIMAGAVHYRENGTWQDYDNRLTYADGEDGAGIRKHGGRPPCTVRTQFGVRSARPHPKRSRGAFGCRW